MTRLFRPAAAAALATASLFFVDAAARRAQANVVLSDTFDDADRDNDGTTDDGLETSVTAADGIAWYGINGLTSDGTKQKPNLTVADDTFGIGTGNALNVEAVGSNGEFIGVFDQSYTLGAGVGSRVSASFDLRFTDLLLPSSGEFRFGLYGDTDNQFGSAAVNSDGVTPTIWGGSDGNFDNENPGAVGDLGAFVRAPFGSFVPSTARTRVADEANANNILGGAGDADLIAIDDELEDPFGVVDDNGSHRYDLSIERVAAGAVSGNTVQVSVTLTDSDGIVTTLAGVDGEVGSSGTEVIASAESFDYFVALVSTDADYFIDNFQLEVVEVEGGLAGDYNGDGAVDGADYTAWRDGGPLQNETASPGVIDSADYDAWVANFGQTAVTANAAIPEPATLALVALGLGVAAGRRSRS